MLKIGSCHCSLSPFFILPFFIRLHSLYPNNIHSYTIKQYDVYCIYIIFMNTHESVTVKSYVWSTMICAGLCCIYQLFLKKKTNFFLFRFFFLLFLDVSLCFSAICMGLSMRNSRPGCLEKNSKIYRNTKKFCCHLTGGHMMAPELDGLWPDSLTLESWGHFQPLNTTYNDDILPLRGCFFYLFNWNSLLLLLLSVVVVVFVITSSASVHFYLWSSRGSWIKAGFLTEGVKYLRDSVNNLRADQVWLQILIRSIFLDFA